MMINTESGTQIRGGNILQNARTPLTSTKCESRKFGCKPLSGSQEAAPDSDDRLLRNVLIHQSESRLEIFVLLSIYLTH